MKGTRASRIKAVASPTRACLGPGAQARAQSYEVACAEAEAVHDHELRPPTSLSGRAPVVPYCRLSVGPYPWTSVGPYRRGPRITVEPYLADSALLQTLSSPYHAAIMMCEKTHSKWSAHTLYCDSDCSAHTVLGWSAHAPPG
eukprot:1910051-Rhodomonas_salina.2